MVCGIFKNEIGTTISLPVPTNSGFSPMAKVSRSILLTEGGVFEEYVDYCDTYKRLNIKYEDPIAMMDGMRVNVFYYRSKLTRLHT